MKIALIAALAENRVIGIGNRMPWHLPADLKKFKALTMGKPIIMGRKTYESIGRPLPGRGNVIVSRNAAYRQPGCLVFADLEVALAYFQGRDEVFVIGGSTLYAAVLPLADTLYLTHIHRNFEGDTLFPEIDCARWVVVERLTIDDDPAVDFSYSFERLERKPRALVVSKVKKA